MYERQRLRQPARAIRQSYHRTSSEPLALEKAKSIGPAVRSACELVRQRPIVASRSRGVSRHALSWMTRQGRGAATDVERLQQAWKAELA